MLQAGPKLDGQPKGAAAMAEALRLIGPEDGKVRCQQVAAGLADQQFQRYAANDR
jgi:hypothetical protein